MKSAVLLSNNYFVALAFLFSWSVDEALSCDTNWIRLVYMLSCGKKKRESVWAQNNTFYENLPPDFDGAFKYFKEKDPFNPMLSDALIYEILHEDDDKNNFRHKVPKLLIFNEQKEELHGRESAAANDKPIQQTSVFIKKLFPKTESGNHLVKFQDSVVNLDNFAVSQTRKLKKFPGIQGFPAQWDIEEIFDEKINENHRREISRLIEECCKVPRVSSCDKNTFSRHCK